MKMKTNIFENVNASDALFNLLSYLFVIWIISATFMIGSLWVSDSDHQNFRQNVEVNKLEQAFQYEDQMKRIQSLQARFGLLEKQVSDQYEALVNLGNTLIELGQKTLDVAAGKMKTK